MTRLVSGVLNNTGRCSTHVCVKTKDIPTPTQRPKLNDVLFIYMLRPKSFMAPGIMHTIDAVRVGWECLWDVVERGERGKLYRHR